MKALSVLLCCIVGAGAVLLIPFQIPQTLGRTGAVTGYQPQYPPDIFQSCFKQAQIPMDVALGNYFQFQFMCSGDFFQYCRTQLPVALTQSIQLYPNQRDYVMNHLLSWVDGGGRFLCNMGQNVIAGVMQNGGQDCIQTTAATKIAFCQQSLDNLNTGLDYNNQYCGQLDNTLQCYIDAINMCPNNNLRDFFWDFFKSVQRQGPCASVSRFVNSASRPAKNIFVTITSAISLFFIVKAFFS